MTGAPTVNEEVPMSRVRSTTVVYLVLVLVALFASAITGGSAASAAPLTPALGSNVIVFDPSMPVGQIQATLDAIHAQQVDAEMTTNRYALLFEPGVYGSAEPTAAVEGRLLHRARRPGRIAGGRDDQRQDRGLQPLPRQRRHEQLPRPRQLLAHAFQPVAEHQRRSDRTAAARLRTSGLSRRPSRCAGSTSAAPPSR